MAEDCDDVTALHDSCDIVTLDDFREAEEDSLIDNSYLTPVYIELDNVNDMGGSQNGVEKDNVPGCADSDRVNLDSDIDVTNANAGLPSEYAHQRHENAGYVHRDVKVQDLICYVAH